MEKPFNDISNEVLEILPIEVEEEEVLEDETKAELPDIPEEEVFVAESKEPVVKVKKGSGKRGPDKKPRKKKIVSEAVIIALSKAREASVAKRIKIRDERAKIRLEIKEKENDEINERLRQKNLTPPSSPKGKKQIIPILKEQPSERERFMGILDEWDAKKKLTKQKRKEQLQNQPHPAGRRIPQTQLPVPPPNPFDEIFKYRGSNRSTYW